MHARALLLALVVTSLASAVPARACAPAPPLGATVHIAGEEALIVWDAASRTEHFVRRADFSTDARDFGFLVPTPSVPTLAEAPEAVFDALETLREPEIVRENSYVPLTCLTVPFLMMGGAADEVIATSPAVTVLSTQRVAGMDATVLAADDADALAAWLSERGYAMRPALVEWLRPYVAARFAITAFAYAGGESTGSRAVRMTFATDRPFYPYREPTDQPEQAGRSLRVHLVTTGRQAGRLGDGAWSAEVEVARALAPDTRLLEGIAALPERAWVTTFLDRASRRPPEHDLAFTAAATDEEHVPRIVRTHEVIIPLPIEPILLVAGIVYLVRRRKARSTS